MGMMRFNELPSDIFVHIWKPINRTSMEHYKSNSNYVWKA